MRRYELAGMTEKEGWQSIERIQSIKNGWRNPSAVRDLIERQAYFAKLPK
jgi:hypothetical protein